MQRYLISYEFTDGEDQEEGAEMLINCVLKSIKLYLWIAAIRTNHGFENTWRLSYL